MKWKTKNKIEIMKNKQILKIVKDRKTFTMADLIFKEIGLEEIGKRAAQEGTKNATVK